MTSVRNTWISLHLTAELSHDETNPGDYAADYFFVAVWRRCKFRRQCRAQHSARNGIFLPEELRERRKPHLGDGRTGGGEPYIRTLRIARVSGFRLGSI